MKHKRLDLSSEVKRAALPDGLDGFLFPMYEAISNAFHSVEERWQENLEDQGHIAVKFDAANQSIMISDNGVGFNRDNLDAFLTPLTGKKIERGGKGFGRFMAFKVFNKVYYSSAQIDGTKTTSGTYRYEPFSKDDNLIDLSDDEAIDHHQFDLGVTVLMRSPLAAYEDYFVLEGKDRRYRHTAEDIVSAILDHFLIEFVQQKVPKDFTIEIESVPFNLYEYFHDSLRVGGNRTIKLSISDKIFDFEFSYFQVGVDQAKKHRLYFYADNRAASDLETISSGLNTNPFSEIDDERERKYFYLVAVASSFFRSSQSRDRITNLHGKIEYGGKKKPIKDHLVALAKQHILEIESAYTSARRAEMESQIEHLIAIDPLLRRGLGEASASEFVLKRSITETREQLAQDLFVERFRQKFDFTKLDANASVEDLVDIVRTKIPADAKEALAVYVAYRNHVITIFRKLLEKHDDKLATEDRVHELIYPRFKDSEDVDYSSHNLWLLDDDLAYARYISSDRTPEGSARKKGEYAHDLLINNENELMIVEMKRPQKRGYDGTREADTSNPVDQLKKQISAIRKKGKVKASTGREIEISKDSMVRGYVLADWNESLETYLSEEDFILTDFGGHLAYRYYKTLNIMIEVLAFDRLVDRASNRNEAFVQMLDGRSNYDRSRKDPLA
ncbi:MAG: ATP-binding protein [Pseudomonadota bacterium]